MLLASPDELVPTSPAESVVTVICKQANLLFINQCWLQLARQLVCHRMGYQHIISDQWSRLAVAV